MNKITTSRDLAFRTIQEYSEGLSRDSQIIRELQKSSADRLVWFAAISGFALINMPTLAKGIVGSRLTSIELLIIIVPWGLSGLSSIISHWLLSDMIERDNTYFMMKKHVAQSFLATLTEEVTVEEVLAVLNSDETDQEVIKRQKAVNQISPWANRFEKLTFVLLLISFLWSIIYPSILLTI